MAGPGPDPPPLPSGSISCGRRRGLVRASPTYLQGGGAGSSGPGEGDRAHAFLGAVASAARRGGAHPLGWVEGGVGGGSCGEEEQGREGGAPRRVPPGTGVRSWWTRAPPGLLKPLPGRGTLPTLQLRPRSGHRPRQARGPGGRRGTAGGATRCRRPPLAPPGPRHALRPSAAAGARKLRGRARRLGLRHPPSPGDLRAGRLGTPATPGCRSLRCPDTVPAPARRLRPGELRARPPQASAHCDASKWELTATRAARRRAVEPWRVFLPRPGPHPLQLARRGHHSSWGVRL